MSNTKQKFRYLVGNKNISKKALKPYNEEVCSFLDDFSKMLFKEKEAKEYSDLKTLAFWCRKSEISKI